MNIKRVAVFSLVMCFGGITYWLGGGNFDRGSTLGITFMISTAWGLVAASYPDLK